MSSSRQRSAAIRRLICGGCASLLLWTVWPQVAWGQADPGYVSLPYDASLLVKDPVTGADKLDDKQLKTLAQLKTFVLFGNLPYQENSANFMKWYNGYVFRSFTQLDQLSKLPEKRREIIEDLRRARSKEVRDALLQQTLRMMTGFATSPKFNFHPAVRFNALLVIGDLNAEEPVPPQKFPNPLPAALDLLVAEYTKPNQSEAMRLAAMLGILRHAHLDWARAEPARIPAARRQEIAQHMLALVSAKDPPAGGTKEGHAWLQRRALDVLGALGVVGPVDAANKAVVGFVRNPDADLTVRLTAAATLARLNPKSPTRPALDPTAESLQLGALLVQACQQELTNIEDIYRKSMLAGDPSGSSGSMFGDGGGGMMPGGMAPGGMMPGGMAPGGMMPGGMAPGGMAPGGMMPGGMMPGGMSPGGMSPGGMMPGGGRGGTGAIDSPDGGLGDGGLFGGGGGYGAGTPSGSADPRVDLFRRRIKYDVVCVQSGLKAMARLQPPATGGAKKGTPTDEILAECNNVMAATDAPLSVTSLAMLHRSVKKSLTNLEKMTAGLMPKPKPPEKPAEVSDEPSDVPSDAPAAGSPAGAAPAGNKPAGGAAAPGAGGGAPKGASGSS